MAVWDYTLTFDDDSSTLTLTDETASEETGIPSRYAEYQYPGINGLEVLDLGDDVRELTLSGYLHGTSASNLRTKMDSWNAARSRTFTLSVRGSEDSWEDCILVGPPRFTDRYPPQADSSVGCKVTVTIRQLIAA